MYLKKIIKLALEHLNFRFRMTLIFAVIFGVTMISFNLGVFYYVIEALKRDFDDALFNYCVDISETIQSASIDGNQNLDVAPIKIDHGKILPFSLGTAFILLRHRDSRIIGKYGNFGNFVPPLQSELEKIDKGSDAAYKTIYNIKSIPEPESESYRLITFPVENINPQYFIQVVVPRTLLETQIENRLLVIQFGIPFVLLLSMIIGYFLSEKALAPVKKIILKTQNIDANVLSQRVPVPPARDEFNTLAITINQMLERIEKSFLSQERFVADASHQLLSPLTILRSSLEWEEKHIEKTKKDPSEVKTYLKSLLVEVDNLTRIIQDMLLLARMDAGLSALQFQDIQIEEILVETISRLEKKARDKNIKISFNINDFLGFAPKQKADPGLISNLIYNILENAIKYSDSNSNIKTEVIWEPSTTKLNIIDEGPGINVNYKKQIFERFSRTPEQSSKEGFGLGLSIAYKIASLHDAKLKVENNDSRGAIFSIEIKNI